MIAYFIIFLSFFTITSAFIHPFLHKNRIIRHGVHLRANDGASTAEIAVPTSNPISNNSNDTHLEESVITSPKIEQLRKKILESQQLIQTITNDTIKIQNEIKQLDEQYGDQIAMISQDFSRVKQRSLQEKKEVQFRAKSDALKEVFPVCDSFYQYNKLYDRLPIDSHGRKIVERYEQIFEGVDDILHSFGAKRIFCLGKPFDVETMDAIMTSPSTEYRAGLVCGEYQYGYEMEGRCIRPAMVAVSDGPGPATDDTNHTTDTENTNDSSSSSLSEELS